MKKEEKIRQILEQLDSTKTHPKDKIDLMDTAICIINQASTKELIKIEEIKDDRIDAWITKR